jgi:proteasome lid subunit RPN8/RPN11
MGLRISRALQARMLEEAARIPDREVCGLVFGTGDDTVTDIQECINVAASPEDSFEIDPAALIAAHKAERAGGPSLIGCYHSHPNGVEKPSLRDAESDGRAHSLWLIIADNKLVAWRSAGSGTFERVEIDSTD